MLYLMYLFKITKSRNKTFIKLNSCLNNAGGHDTSFPALFKGFKNNNLVAYINVKGFGYIYFVILILYLLF